LKVPKKSVLHFVFFCLIFSSLQGCWRGSSNKHKNLLQGGKLKVSQSDMAFSVEEMTKEPGAEVTFDLVNDLKDEKLRFYLLKDGEDPIVVQHIKAQQGGVPPEYFLFESSDVEPGQEIKVTFNAPVVEGVYSFVGVGATPRESLVGRLIVEKKQLPTESSVVKGPTDDSI